MRQYPLPLITALGIVSLLAATATHASEPYSGPHAWENLSAIEWEGDEYSLYPKASSTKPGLPSPYLAADSIVTVTATLRDGTFAIVPVMLTEEQHFVNREDFPDLARTGLLSEQALLGKQAITGRSIAQITDLGRPGGLSQAGFMAIDEDIISVLAGDNRLVRVLDLIHPELAEPLFHVINLLETDIGFVWANHSWDGLRSFFYNGREIFLTGKGTKGGQESIFADGIQGAWDLDIWREPDENEVTFLKKKYGHLEEELFRKLLEKLSRFHTGEMEPQYIMRYGFYEGHTEYRTDPIAIAFIFGLRTVEEIETAFPGRLLDTLTGHFTAESKTGK